MDVRAAVAYAAGEPLAIETVQLEGPKAGEVLVEIISWFKLTPDLFSLKPIDTHDFIGFQSQHTRFVLTKGSYSRNK